MKQREQVKTFVAAKLWGGFGVCSRVYLGPPFSGGGIHPPAGAALFCPEPFSLDLAREGKRSIQVVQVEGMGSPCPALLQTQPG